MNRIAGDHGTTAGESAGAPIKFGCITGDEPNIFHWHT